MSSIPLYLKIKGAEDLQKTPTFLQENEGSIKFHGKPYDFAKILTDTSKDEEYKELVEVQSDTLSCFIFMGPTGAGKTTTLKKVAHLKCASLQRREVETQLTAFEISENRYVVDLLGDKSEGKKEYLSTVPMEEQLRKELLTRQNSSAMISSIFNRRKTQKTSFNEHSSRSCLILTFFYENTRVTYIDLIGNERFHKSLPSSNVFANVSMSAITQMLTRRELGGRSSSLITNLIFKTEAEVSKKIGIMLNLDLYGDPTLIKSTLNNIAELVARFRLKCSPSPSKLTFSSSNMPHYAQPTASSSSPSRRAHRSPTRVSNKNSFIKPKSLRKQWKSPLKTPIKPAVTTSAKTTLESVMSPIKNTVGLPVKSPTKLPVKSQIKSPIKLASKESIALPVKCPAKSPSKSPAKILGRSQMNLIKKSPIRTASTTLQEYNNLQLISLKNKIDDFEYENTRLKDENRELLEQLKDDDREDNADLTMLKCDNTLELVAMKAEIQQLQKKNLADEKMMEQQKLIKTKLEAFKSEFSNFKENSTSFKNQVSGLKDLLDGLRSENERNSKLLEEKTKEALKIPAMELDLISTKEELVKKDKENTKLLLSLQTLEKDNDNMKENINELNLTLGSYKQDLESKARIIELLEAKQQTPRRALSPVRMNVQDDGTVTKIGFEEIDNFEKFLMSSPITATPLKSNLQSSNRVLTPSNKSENINSEKRLKRRGSQFDSIHKIPKINTFVPGI
ncbi:uncharacterized protein PRCAT00003026001 [Priceomyces carsonii]|uniref:uncharacterized protein n=1 Tax=Priceomyces carsonii TaxID=28549 RepID=UPI002EDB7675|nr:unnamed protein product [Priceomyces carsonii]